MPVERVGRVNIPVAALRICNPPPWYSHKGAKMRPDAYAAGKSLAIRASAAEVLINAVARESPEGWEVLWKVDHGSSRAQGMVRCRDEDLLRCFGLQDGLDRFSTLMAQKLGCELDAAMPGGYVRRGSYLNIPCAAPTGMDDPCVSIHLDEEVRGAVAKLINDRYRS